jgi:hypothetical protein
MLETPTAISSLSPRLCGSRLATSNASRRANSSDAKAEQTERGGFRDGGKVGGVGVTESFKGTKPAYLTESGAGRVMYAGAPNGLVTFGRGPEPWVPKTLSNIVQPDGVVDCNEEPGVEYAVIRHGWARLNRRHSC